MAHVFISYHKTSSRPYARKLANHLIRKGFDVWIDDSIDFGDQWERIIFDKGIDRAGALVVIMTQGAWESIWVLRERNYAESKGVPIFPFRVEDFIFPTYTSTQYVDVRNWKLPPASFIEKLEKSGLPRNTSFGADVTTNPQTTVEKGEFTPAQITKQRRLQSINNPTGYIAYVLSFYRRLPARERLSALTRSALLVSLLVVAMATVFILKPNNVDGNVTPSASATYTQNIVINLPTASSTATVSPQPTFEPSATTNLTLTSTVAITQIPPEYWVSQTAIQQSNLTLTASMWTNTPTPISTYTSIPTEFWLTQTALSAANLTLTATVWTPTASPTASPTLTSTTTPPPPYISLNDSITSNEQWQPYIDVYARAFNSVDMVLVPSGCFQMGNDPSAGSTGGALDGGRQCIDAFWLDRYEVSNAQFAQLGGRAASASAFPSANQPRDTVTWFEARDFCALRGARLPTEAEWEYAARGVNALVYPWGANWEPEDLAWAGNSGSGTANIGSHPQGRSWIGADDLLGNVWEWVSTVYGIDNGDYDFLDSSEQTFPYPYNQDDGREQDTDNPNYVRVIRGGSWLNDVGNFRAAVRNASAPALANNRIGIRCALDY